MAAGRDDNAGLHDVGVHAALGAVVEGDQGPVGDHTSNLHSNQSTLEERTGQTRENPAHWSLELKKLMAPTID